MSKKLYDEDGNVVEGVKVKKPFYKRWWFIALVALFIIGAIGGGDDEESLETTEAETEEVVEETEPEEIEQEPEEIEEIEEVVEEEAEVEEEPEEPEEAEETELSREDRIYVANAIMSDSFSSMAEVDYDASADVLTILPTDEQFTLEIVYMMMGYEENIKDWNQLVKSLSELSISVSEIVDEDIQIAILNPEDSEKVLVLVQDGFVLYNFANEI